jgi:hypothetical protein
LPCLALPCLALPCLALPCLSVALPCLAVAVTVTVALPCLLLTINPEFPPNPEKKHVLGFIGCYSAEIFFGTIYKIKNLKISCFFC